MAVDTSIWVKAGTKYGMDYSKTLAELINDKKLKLNATYDKSIVLWKREPFPCHSYAVENSKPIIVGEFNTNGGVVLSGTIDTYKNGFNFPIKMRNTFTFTNGSAWAWSPGQGSLTEGNVQPYAGNVITKMVYKNYAILIKIVAAKNKDYNSDAAVFDCNTYYNGTNNITYPYIRRVYGVSYISNNGTSNRTTQTGIFNKFCTPQALGRYTLNVRGKWEWETMPVTIPTDYDIRILGSFSADYGTTYVNCVNMGASINASDFNNFVFYDDLAEIYYNITDPEARQQYVTFNYTLTKQEVIQYALKWGFIVATSTAGAADITCTNPDVYIPIISSSGSVTNAYTQGESNLNNPQLKWNDPWSDSGYDPSDPNDYTDKIDLNKPKLTTTGIFNRSFAITGNDLNTLADYLWNADETIFDEIIKGLGLMGNNPIDSLIDCRLYPFNVADLAGGGISQSIVVGRTDTGVQALMINSQNAIIDMGSCTFHRHYKNFLDYEPFTSASLYIPYCGIVAIPTAEFVGKTISAKLIVDITSGACTAIVFADDIPYLYKNGTIGIDIPMTATNSADYASRIMNGVISGTVNTALGAATGNAAQAIGGAMGLANTALSINNSNVQTTGSSAPACSLWQPQNCYFIIRRPVVNEPENYAHTVGYACCKSGTIGNFSGYTQAINVDLSTINATEEEKDQIQELLRNGVYL